MIKAIFIFQLALMSIIVNGQSPSTIITTNSEADIIPEGIAVDGKTNTIYVSSINRHKIITVDRNGKTRDFIAPDQDGYLSGLGMTIDTVRNWIWAISIQLENKLYFSKVHAFDLKTGKTMQKYMLKDTSNHLLNDLALMNDGNIYITDSYYGAIYKLDPEKKEFGLFEKSDLTGGPNGIVGIGDQLMIATYANGIVNLNIKTKALTKMPGIKDSVLSHGLDGMALHDNMITGVNNMNEDQSKNVVIQYTLNPNADSVVEERILDKGNKYFTQPTTVAYSKEKLYVLANSYIGEYNKNNYSAKGIERKLKPVTILVYAGK